MEPHHEEPKKPAQPRQQPKKRRFQLIKLEERIAPDKGGTTNAPHGCFNFTKHHCILCF